MAETAATAILQSSSVISLVVLAFVGAQMIELRNALAVIMGANLGTTFTGWIVAFLGFEVKIESFAYPLIAIGLLAMTLVQKQRVSHRYARLIAGFGLLFFGLGFMKEAMDGFAQNFDLSVFKTYGIFVFFLVGMIFTAVIQSSSATMALSPKRIKYANRFTRLRRRPRDWSGSRHNGYGNSRGYHGHGEQETSRFIPSVV